MTNLWTLGEFSRHGHMVLWPSVILAGFSFHQPWSLMYRTNVEEIESFTNFKTPPLFTFGQFPSAALNVGFSPLCQFLKLPSLCHVSFPLKKKLADGGPGDRLKSQALSGATGLELFLFFDGSFLDGVEGRDVAGLWRRECPKCSLDFLFFLGGSGDKLFDEEECSDNEIAVWYGYWKSCSKMYVVHICICILNLTDYTYALDSWYTYFLPGLYRKSWTFHTAIFMHWGLQCRPVFGLQGAHPGFLVV